MTQRAAVRLRGSERRNVPEAATVSSSSLIMWCTKALLRSTCVDANPCMPRKAASTAVDG